MLSSKSFMKCERPSARADHPSTAHLARDSVLTAVPLHVSPGSPEPHKLHEVQSMPETGVQTPAGQNSEGFLGGPVVAVGSSKATCGHIGAGRTRSCCGQEGEILRGGAGGQVRGREPHEDTTRDSGEGEAGRLTGHPKGACWWPDKGTSVFGEVSSAPVSAGPTPRAAVRPALPEGFPTSQPAALPLVCAGAGKVRVGACRQSPWPAYGRNGSDHWGLWNPGQVFSLWASI